MYITKRATKLQLKVLRGIVDVACRNAELVDENNITTD